MKYNLLIFRVEKQQKDAREKVNQHQAQATAAQIKAQMEEQLKQQRLALQQKRLQESQAKLNNAASTNVAVTPTITLTKPLTVIGTVNNTNKPTLTTLASQASAAGGTPYKGIRRIFTTKGAKPGQCKFYFILHLIYIKILKLILFYCTY